MLEEDLQSNDDFMIKANVKKAKLDHVLIFYGSIFKRNTPFIEIDDNKTIRKKPRADGLSIDLRLSFLFHMLLFSSMRAYMSICFL